MRLEDLEGKRVAILGLGREGRSACRLLAGRARPAVLDVFSGTEPAESPDGPPANLYPGLPDPQALAGYDVVIRSPGISPYRPPLSELPAGGPAIITGADIWFAEHPEARTVVVTGSKGKSTTAALTAHLLEGSGLRIALGGNIGVPLLDLMDTGTGPDVWIFELSSFQIQGLRARPSVAVVLNLFPEHLDWHVSRERYFRDKLSLLEGMDDKPVVLNHTDDELRARTPAGANVHWYNHAPDIHWAGNAVFRGSRRLFALDDFALPGSHNRSNLCAALTVMAVLDLDPAGARDSLATFQALPHRLHSLGVRDGIEYVDDSISTTPQATIAALECYPGRPVTVLVGGFDRGLDWHRFARFAADRDGCRVVTFGALGPRIAATLAEVPGVPVAETRTLEEALGSARDQTPLGGVVLLSPGAPSFDAFRDYRDRGDAFTRLAGFEPGPTD